ncbi:hypothetical protein PTKIN_Ptkin04bG0086900 [Pterospermum kingtungense]
MFRFIEPICFKFSFNFKNEIHLQKPHLKESQFDLIPIIYIELYPQLLQSHLVVTVQGFQRNPSFSKWYDVNTRCEYHIGILGNLLENYIAFKKKVQELLKDGKLKF